MAPLAVSVGERDRSRGGIIRVEGRQTRSIWLAEDGWAVEAIDQTRLPHEFRVARMESVLDAARAIRSMQVRGAPLIGVAAAYGMALAMREDSTDQGLARAGQLLLATRPTAVNLRWAVEEMSGYLGDVPPGSRAEAAYRRAGEIADADVATCRAIGEHGAPLLLDVARAKASGDAVQVLTHCNAGALATVDWGTATAPVYVAHGAGVALHVWVSETRPRNQGAGLTAWELGQHGVPHTVIPDGAAGHLMRTGRVDLLFTGTDRTTRAGDVCNKIGTYLKAVAARDNRIPYYAAVPGPSIDWSLDAGDGIPIEERAGDEVTWVRGAGIDGQLTAVRVTPVGSRVANYAFDVTPARLVTGLITERGVCEASREGLLSLYPERAASGDTADT